MLSTDYRTPRWGYVVRDAVDVSGRASNLQASGNTGLLRALNPVVRAIHLNAVRVKISEAARQLSRGTNTKTLGVELEAGRKVGAALREQIFSVGQKLEAARKENSPLREQLVSVGQELEVERRRNLALEAMLDAGRELREGGLNPNARPSSSSGGATLRLQPAGRLRTIIWKLQPSIFGCCASVPFG
jgi:hypothetical protein